MDTPSPPFSLLTESYTAASVVEEDTPSSLTVRLRGASGSRTVLRQGSSMSRVKVSVLVVGLPVRATST